jgi:hypothetical protein
MEKRFFYAATAQSNNKPEIKLFGHIDTDEAINTQKITDYLVIDLQGKGYRGVNIYISQLNFLMDVPDANT